MIGISVKVEGQKEVIDAIRRAQALIGDGIQKAITAACVEVEKEAKHLVAVDTGRLKQSVTHEVALTAKRTWSGRVGTNVHYGPHVEFGTRRMRAQPWLRPAFENKRKLILSIIEQAVKEQLG